MRILGTVTRDVMAEKGPALFEVSSFVIGGNYLTY